MYARDFVGYFIWDWFEVPWRLLMGVIVSYFWDIIKTFLMKSWDVPTEMSWWRSSETSLSVSCETYQWRLWHVQIKFSTMPLTSIMEEVKLQNQHNVHFADRYFKSWGKLKVRSWTRIKYNSSKLLSFLNIYGDCTKFEVILTIQKLFIKSSELR